jgi:hypothetical protein
MPVFRSIPSLRVINGTPIETSDSAVVINQDYETNGEYVIIYKGDENHKLTLNHNNTDHVVVKSLTNVLVFSENLIDEEFNEVELDKGSCVEFKYINGFWYILSSDGLKNS